MIQSIKSRALRLFHYLPYLGFILLIFMVNQAQKTANITNETLSGFVQRQEDVRNLLWVNLLLQRSTSLAMTAQFKEDSSILKGALNIAEAMNNFLPSLDPAAFHLGDASSFHKEQTKIRKEILDFQKKLKDISIVHSSAGPISKINRSMLNLQAVSDSTGLDLNRVESEDWYGLLARDSQLASSVKEGQANLRILMGVFAGYLFMLVWTQIKKDKAEVALKKSEMTLHQKNRTLQKAQSLARLGIWTWLKSDDSSVWSPEVYEIFGLDPKQASPNFQAALDCIHPDDRIRFTNGIFLGSIAPKAPEEIEFRIVTHSGTPRNCSLLCEREKNKSGEVVSFLVLLQDITDRRNNDVLRSERDAAEKANHAKSTFLANMSHELRTPMHGILGFARIGQHKIDTASKDKLKSYFVEINESASRLLDLLNDLLDLSKLEAGKIVYSMKESNLYDIATTLITEMSAFANEKGIKMQIESPSTDIMGIFDGGRIMQVVRNLLSNAIKFSDAGGTVRVIVNKSHGKIRCEVINTGVGIPESELETVFDKFVQSSKTKTGAGGTGLGLAICREIIHQHGGKIWAESAPGGETKFTFEFLPALSSESSPKTA